MHQTAAADPLTALDRGRAWVLGRLHGYLARYGLRLLQGGDALGDLCVGPDEAGQILAGSTASAVAVARVLSRLGLPARPPAAPEDLSGLASLAGLGARFGLDALDQALLFAAAAPALWVDVDRLYRFAWADFAVRRSTVGFLCELVTAEPAAALAAQARFRPDGALVRGELLRFEGPGPRLHQGVAVPDGVVAALRGEGRWIPEGLARAIGPVTPPRLPLLLPPETARPLARLVEAAVAAPDGGPPLLLLGPAGSGRASGLAGALRDAGRALIKVELEALPQDDRGFEAGLAEAARCARLEGAGLLLEADRLAEGPDAAARWASICARLGAHPGVAALAAPRLPAALRRDLAGAVTIAFKGLPTAEQRALWVGALAAGEVAAPAGLADELARRYDAPPGVIRAAAAEAAAEARLRHTGPGLPALTADALDAAVRRRLHHALDEVADRITTTLVWEDVVLPPEVRTALDRIRVQARLREQVLDAWGFRRLLSYGRGLGCLFSGPPGTGKTMVAGLLASELRRPLYRVDLSRVVSKWIGETEKNLARVFDEAQRAQAILFFDEADSLFSTRTEVKGSNDRFANMEINYLLQRMEDFDGMSILATNFERSLDEAFKRRLRFKIHFPLPDEGGRRELWRRVIPPGAPLAEGVDFAPLGRKFKLSGGSIKNAALRAAFDAAEAGGEITQALLMAAAEAELREMGHL